MEQLLSESMLQTLSTIVPEIVMSNIDEAVKEIKTLANEQSFTKKEVEMLKKENKELKEIVAEHQRFLSMLDAERRSNNVIITGVAEARPR
jgi:vacuolar-type H+-ATPase subunit I/STV1